MAGTAHIPLQDIPRKRLQQKNFSRSWELKLLSTMQKKLEVPMIKKFGRKILYTLRKREEAPEIIVPRAGEYI